MRANEYAAWDQQPLEEVWAGLRKYLVGVVPPADRAAAGGEQEMAKFVQRHIAVILQLAGRYKDSNDNPIRSATLHDMPARALINYMRTKMQLPPEEIQRILNSVVKNPRLLGMKTPPGLKISDLTDEDATLGSVWGVSNGKIAEVLLDKLISVAAIRQMEINEFGDEGTGTQGPQASTAQGPQASTAQGPQAQRAQATQPAAAQPQAAAGAQPAASATITALTTAINQLSRLT